MNRAYSVLNIRAVNEDERVIEGIASTPTADRMGDVVEPLGAKFALPMPLLWQHNANQPVGHVEFAEPTEKGIPFKARVVKVDEPGTLKDRTDEAWQSVKLGLVSAVSIGFRSLSYEIMKEGGLRFKEWEWLELSLVTVPANADATITTIKSIDAQQRAASGNSAVDVVRPSKTGVAVKSIPITPARNYTMNIQEQIKAFEATRTQKSAAMTALMQKAADDGVTLDADQSAEYDGLLAEVKSIDEHLVRLKDLEKTSVANATDVTGVKTVEGASNARGAVPASVKKELPKGTAFTRYAIALARSKGNVMQAAEIAKDWGDTPEVETVLRAAVSAGTTTDAAWAKPLVEYQNMSSEFVDLLRPQTIIGRIPGLRNVPFNINIPRQTAGSSAQWVGEGKPKPVSSLAFDNIKLGHAKLAGIVVLTDELVKFSNPSAEALVRQDLINTIVQTMDKDFVDPAKAAGAGGVSPASITNGVTPVTASGKTADDVRADVKALFGKFLSVNMSLSGAVWIMTETQALGLALLLNPLGQPEFNGLSINGNSGGTFFGLPVVLSENIPANAGSGDPLEGAGSRIILAKATEILLADDGQVMLDASREASLEMDSAPSGNGSSLISLWQHNMVGIRAERFINWAKRRDGVVQFIDSANYGG
ncbi:phage major capsid protein [Paenochrobactrum sp. BZR 588]|uniref:phage major capsid protein n=1 Tax=unclassified Paenochrobactrum TaxID=2639760 RepID=UPI003854170D